MTHAHGDLSPELERTEPMSTATSKLVDCHEKLGDIEARLTALENRFDQHYLVLSQALLHISANDTAIVGLEDSCARNFSVVVEAHNQLIEVLIECLNRYGDISPKAIRPLKCSKIESRF